MAASQWGAPETSQIVRHQYRTSRHFDRASLRAKARAAIAGIASTMHPAAIQRASITSMMPNIPRVATTLSPKAA